MIDPAELVDSLNPRQREAVTHGEGPLLILAGAGSGKTRVITHRIAHLIATGSALPREVVAVTFTNKAAAEMRERVERLTGGDLGSAFVGTFHAMGLKILRTHAAEAGFSQGFVIYDTADQLSLVRDAIKRTGADEKAFPARQVRAWISKQKNALATPADAENAARYPHEKIHARLFGIYEENLARAGAVDFDDLLVKTIDLFRREETIKERYAIRTRWLLVDEYQDTNAIQYKLIRMLSGSHRNVCCVGDEDQSIYAFRGADIRNILDFERDFPDAKIVKLEQNYRSTGNILQAASSIIRNNVDRHDKSLWTDNEAGPPIRIQVAADDRDEADLVVGAISAAASDGDHALEEIAILYRTNATSRLFEERLTARRIPYRVVGSLRFYERKEIKDVLAWLRMIAHPDSDADFQRVAAVPPRGIGAKTMADVAAEASARGSSLYDAARVLVNDPARLTPRARRAVGTLLETLDGLRSGADPTSTSTTLKSAIEEVGYLDYLEKSYPSDHATRAENLDALVSAATEHDESGAPDGLSGFLDRVSLRSDTDSVSGEQGPSLMTVHSAKGLEFDCVFLVGMNEDLFPHQMASRETNGIEEERRLAYVAITRARKSATLTTALYRHHFGTEVRSNRSRFLDEIPGPIVEERGSPMTGRGRGTSSSRRPSRPAKPREAPTPAAGTWQPSGRLSYEKEAATRADPASEGTGFVPGMRVIHPSLGPGKVLSRSVSTRGEILDIRFDMAGRKRIMAAKAGLRPG